MQLNRIAGGAGDAICDMHRDTVAKYNSVALLQLYGIVAKYDTLNNYCIPAPS
jgi:hypothetical protein